MRDLLSSLARWLLRHLISFVLIVAVLLAGNWLLGEARRYDALSGEAAGLRGGRDAIERQLRAMQGEAAARVHTLRAATREQLDARIAQLDGEITQVQAARGGLAGLPLPGLGTSMGEAFGKYAQDTARLAVMEEERDFLKTLRAALDYRAAQQKLRAAEGQVAAADEALRINSGDQAALETEKGMARMVPGTQGFNEMLVLRNASSSLKHRAAQARAELEEQRRYTAGMIAPVVPASFEVGRAKIDAALAPLDAELRKRDDELGRNWIKRASGPVVDVLPTAALILLGLILTPVAIKALFYYVIAPAASRRPAIHVLPEAGAVDAQLLPPGEPLATPSSVSRAVNIDARHELLVHPEYLQSTSVHGRKDTKWLLSWRMPFSSLASGMFALTRVRTKLYAEAAPQATQERTHETVVISALKDPLAEVALLDLPEGAALVLQPRALAGAVYPIDKPLRITRHWRLFSLQAWLTLQLRYLAFHGPAQLVVKGCRGVRVEAAGKGRRINQGATLGFSAHAAYSVVRCETFVAYLTGEEELFNDSFAGEAAYFLYEEVPHGGKKPGITGRGLEGFSDSVLKVFGI